MPATPTSDRSRAPGAGELVTFEEPLAIGRPDHESLGLDQARKRQQISFFLLRTVVATLLCGAAPLLAGDVTALTLGIALLYVPLAAWSTGAIVEQRAWGSFRSVVGMIADVAVLTAFELAVSEPSTLPIGGIAFVALHTWVGGRRAGVLTLGTLLTAGLVARALGDLGFDAVLNVGAVLTAALLVHLVDDQSTMGSRAVSGLRLVHDKAEAILAGIADAVITTSATGEVSSINRAAEGVLGCDASAAVSMGCGDLLQLRDGATHLTCRDRCQLLERYGSTTVELHRTGPAGQRQPLLASATALVDGDGTVVEVVHSFRDITSVKQADEAKTLFLATASHELKTPLTVIRGFAQMLRTTELDPKRRADATTAIEARAVQLSSIVDRLLMTSRIEAGRVELHPSMTRVEEIVSQRSRELESATSRRVDIRLPDDDLPPAWVDPDALTTILDHLLENAVKYSPNGGPITIEVSAGADLLLLRCSDEGVGMNAEQRDRCFDRFWQAEGTDVRRFGGTGIGLYIVRSLVDAMHGDIEVASAPGEGTTFTMSLLRHPPRERPLDETPGSLESSEGSMIDQLMRQVGLPIEAERNAR